MSRLRAFLLCLWLAERLPPAIVYLLAALAGEVSFWFNRPGRRVAIVHMRRVLGPAASRRTVRRAARACFRPATRYYADLAQEPKMQPECFLRENVRVIGLEHLTEATASVRA